MRHCSLPALFASSRGPEAQPSFTGLDPQAEQCALRPLHALYPIFVDNGKERGHCEGSGGCHTLKQVAERIYEGWAHGGDVADYIVDDGGEIAIVFGRVHENAGDGIPDEHVDRKSFERLAAAYLAEHPE